jgi:RNA polymerase sigma-70 factor (ECF subfamily)
MQDYAIYEDQFLIHLISKGDTLAFTELYNRHKDKLYSFSMDMVGSPEKANDLVHDVFLKIWEQRSSLKGKEVFSGYLYTMVRNFCIDHFRKFARESLINRKLAENGKENFETPESDLLYRDLQNKVQQAINNLPPRQKEIYILHREERLKYNEIAQKLNLSVSTVENHFSRAMVSIRIFLGSEYAGILLYGSISGMVIFF